MPTYKKYPDPHLRAIERWPLLRTLLSRWNNTHTFTTELHDTGFSASLHLVLNTQCPKKPLLTPIAELIWIKLIIKPEDKRLSLTRAAPGAKKAKTIRKAHLRYASPISPCETINVLFVCLRGKVGRCVTQQQMDSNERRPCDAPEAIRASNWPWSGSWHQHRLGHGHYFFFSLFDVIVRHFHGHKVSTAQGTKLRSVERRRRAVAVRQWQCDGTERESPSKSHLWRSIGHVPINPRLSRFRSIRINPASVSFDGDGTWWPKIYGSSKSANSGAAGRLEIWIMELGEAGVGGSVGVCNCGLLKFAGLNHVRLNICFCEMC